MKTKFISSFLIFAVLSLSSCKMFMYAYFPKKADLKVMKNETTQKEVVFIPMYHVNRPGFFDDVKQHVDSLKDNGYVLFYEGLAPSPHLDSLTIDTLKLKFRKLFGAHLTNYKNPDNKSTPKYLRNNKFVDQTMSNTGVTEKDFRADLPLEELIRRFEEEYRPITLTDCDFNTPLLEKYDCETINYFDAIFTIRENYLMDNLLNSKHDKIVVLYGQAHWKFVYPELYKKGYKLVHGKI